MTPDLVEIPAGTSVLGSDVHYPEERPAREVAVEPFAVARTPCTVGEFATFVRDTGYLTRAERDLDGSAVFTPPKHPVDLRDPNQWWSWVDGASWQAPTGPGSVALDDHPVTHVVLEDALAYSAWAGLRLPTEAEWEHAARGGLAGAAYAWGDERGDIPAVVFRGEFPWLSAGPATTAPVGTHPPNGYGLLDVTGNVWELVDTAWTANHVGTPCCAPSGTEAAVVAKGGSFLCSDDYCSRYRPAARIPIALDSPTAHVGFRCAAPSRG